MDVEYVSALQPGTGSLIKSLNLADRAVVISVLTKSQLFIEFHAFFVQAGDAACLSTTSAAVVTAWQYFTA